MKLLAALSRVSGICLRGQYRYGTFLGE
jgi:hypothetical protein